MAVERQRFCPVCDRLFNEGEAVLRCTACEVQHHPACWVRNNGCATDGPHNASPRPEAYGIAPLPVPVQAEVPANRPAREPLPAPVPSPRRSSTPPLHEELVIGRTAPARPSPTVDVPAAPAAANRSRARAGRYPDLSGSTKSAPMPSIYPGHRYLRFWYLPIAAALAVFIALGVIVAADRIFSGDSEKASAAGDEAPTATITDAAAGETTPAKATTTAPAQVTIVATPAGQDATPPAPGSLSAGTKAVVAGTGECLNVRTAAGLGNDAIACIPDGTSVTLLGGPAEADQLTWWQIETPQGTGWAAADYLSVE